MNTITEQLELQRIKDTVRANSIAGRQPFDGLESSEIGRYNRAMMFGDNDEAFPSQAAMLQNPRDTSFAGVSDEAQETHRLGQVQWNAYKQVVRRLLAAGAVCQADLNSVSTDVSTPGRKLLREIEAYGKTCGERQAFFALVEAGVTEANS